MATKRRTRLPAFNELGCRALPVESEEIVAGGAVEEMVDGGDETVLQADCQVTVTTKDGRRWTANTTIELYPEGE